MSEEENLNEKCSKCGKKIEMDIDKETFRIDRMCEDCYSNAGDYDRGE